ncbi:MAG TPA: hypothetical protein VN285_09675 [Candidatus Deferrimicrobium sp.]|nr:hypothetical protein [Candidatus Deferrimicrobium sp.]
MGLVLAAAALAVCVPLLVSTVRVMSGVSKVTAAPMELVRLQIVNGSGSRLLLSETAKKLSGHADARLEVRIVDTVNLTQQILPRSLVLSREQNTTGAGLVAALVGFDPNEVLYKPLTYNVRQISTTLILGEDFVKMRNPKRARS